MNKVKDVINFLNKSSLSIATAESCTAGLAAAMMANISGCGSALQCGYVVYTEEAKNCCLGVSLQTMKTYGLTSEEVAREMALGALNNCSAHLTLAITGTAESDDCMDGVICFAYALRTIAGYRLLSETKSFNGTRNEVRKAAALHAIMSIPIIYETMQSIPEVKISSAQSTSLLISNSAGLSEDIEK